MTFGEKLRQLRTEQFLTQEAVADAIGVSVQAYDAYEQNRYFPSDGKIYGRLAILFETTVMKLTDVEHDSHEQTNKEVEPKRSFGQRLYLQRLKKEWTMAQVAEKIGVSEFKYRQMEYQNLRPETMGEYERIADLYEVGVAYFLEGDINLASIQSAQRNAKSPQTIEQPIEPTIETTIETEIKPTIETEAEPEIETESTIETAVTEEPEPTTETDRKGAQMTFGEKLKQLREQKNMTGRAVAQAVGISSKSYSHYERGISVPRKKGLYEKLAETLDTTVEYLTGESEEPKAPQETELAASPKSELTLGQKLLILRKELKLSQIDAAKLIGISLDVYKRMEARNGRPRSIDVYDKVAAAFGCEVSYLAEGDYRVVPLNPTVESADAGGVENMDATATADSETTLPDEALKNSDATENAENENPAAETILNDDLTIESATDEEVTQIASEPMTEEPISVSEEKIEKISEPIAEPIPEKAVMEKVAPIAETAVENTSSPSESVMENTVTQKPVENASVEAITLVSRLSMLLAGNRLSQSEKDALMVSLNSAYWSSRLSLT